MGVFDFFGKKLQNLSRSLAGREHPGAERAVPAEQVPAWKPEFLIPVDDPKDWGGALILIRSIVHPAGSIHAFTAVQHEPEKAGQNLADLMAPLGGKDIEVATRVMTGQDLPNAARQVIETESGPSRPNTFFLNLGENDLKDPMVQKLAEFSSENRLGLVILYQYRQAAFGVQQDINLWLRDESPNWRLASLIGIRLQMNWHGSLNIITVAPTREESRRLYQFHEHLGERLPLPDKAEFLVMAGDFRDALARAPRADLNIFGISEGLSFDFMRTISRTTKSSCLFIRASEEKQEAV